MIKESQPRESRTSVLPRLNIHPVGDQLFYENRDYNQLPPDKLEEVGIHTSFVRHDSLDGKGPCITIHFRRNLGELKGEKGLGRARAFLEVIGEDLDLLARRLIGDPTLNDVEMIYGLTHLSAAWGRKHSFATVHYTNDPELIRYHLESILGISVQEADLSKSLTLFLVSPQSFIEEFLRKDPNDPRLKKVRSH